MQGVVLFLHPEHVRYFLVEKPRNFVKYDLGNLRFLLDDGSLTSDGDFHRQQRRLVPPAFHKHSVEDYAETMGEERFFTRRIYPTCLPLVEVRTVS